MKRTLTLLGLLVTLVAGTAAAQASIQVAVGFGTPRLSGYVVVGDPSYFAHPIFLPARRVWVVPRYEFDRWRHDRAWDRRSDRGRDRDDRHDRDDRGRDR